MTLHGKKMFVLFVTMSIMLAYSASEMYLPAMPLLQQFLHTTTGELQTTVTIYFFGLGTAQLIGGPIADRFDYRSLAIASCLVFIVTSLLCSFATTLTPLIITRFIQAFSGGMVAVIGRASLSRKFTPEETTHAYLYISPSLTLSLTVSPFIGGYLAYWINWQATFYAMALFAVFLFVLILRQLHIPKEKFSKISIHPTSIAKTYYSLLSNRVYVAATFATVSVFSVQLAFLTETPFIFANLGYTSAQIGKFFIPLSLSFFVATWFARRWKARFSYQQFIYIGLGSVLIGSLAIGLCTFYEVKYAAQLYLPSILVGFGGGFLIPLGTAKAISMFPEKAGYASGFLSACNMILAAIAASFVNDITHSNAVYLSAYMVAIAAVCCLCFFLLMPRKAD